MEPVGVGNPEQVLRHLGIPVSEPILRQVADVSPVDLWRYADRLIQRWAAARIWRNWHPGDPGADRRDLMEAFRSILVQAFSMGLRLDRFRELSHRLPEAGQKAWRDYFETCVAGDEVGTIRLTLSHEQFIALQATNRKINGQQSWDGLMDKVSDEIFDNLGLIYAPPRIKTDSSLVAPWFRCEWNDLQLPETRGLTDRQILVDATVERLAQLHVDGEAAVHPVTGKTCAVIDVSQAEIIQQASLESWTWLESLSFCVSGTIQRAAGAFANRSLYDFYSLRLGELSPDLVKCLEDKFAPSFVVRVLRALLEEGISVKNLSAIFDAMLEPRSMTNVDWSKYIVFAPPTGGIAPNFGAANLATMTPANYADIVRPALRRQISNLYTKGTSTMTVFLLDPDLEKRFARRIKPAESMAFLAELRTEVQSFRPGPTPPILTTVEIRRRVWRSVFPEFPLVPVVSYQELSPDMNIQPIARISPDI